MPPTQRDEGCARRSRRGAWSRATPVLVLSQYVERQYARELLADRGGGVGYLLKDRVADVRDFVDALATRRRGRDRPRSRGRRPAHGPAPPGRPALGAHAARARGARGDGRGPHERRDRQALSITEGAAEKHISNIFGKLDLPDSRIDHRRVLAVLAYLGAEG